MKQVTLYNGIFFELEYFLKSTCDLGIEETFDFFQSSDEFISISIAPESRP